MQSCQNYGFNSAPIWFPAHGERPQEATRGLTYQRRHAACGGPVNEEGVRSVLTIQVPLRSQLTLARRNQKRRNWVRP